ncbi:MAG: hypothetical protein IE935_11195, partial [Micrococcales bacterium]|nr:hypothetical protein [Micrococcales bacterium]
MSRPTTLWEHTALSIVPQPFTRIKGSFVRTVQERHARAESDREVNAVMRSMIAARAAGAIVLLEAAGLGALAAWEAMGAEVEEVTEKIDWIEYEGRVLYQANFAVFCAQYLPKWQNQMDPVTLAFMERGARFTLADFRNAQFARTALFRKIQTLFERYDFLVMPTNARTALDVTHDAANDEVVIDGVKCGITRQGWTSYQYPFNLTGHPACAYPSGFGADGLGSLMAATVEARQAFEAAVREAVPEARFLPADSNIACFSLSRPNEGLSQSNARTQDVFDHFQGSPHFAVSRTTLGVDNAALIASLLGGHGGYNDRPEG